MGIFFVGSDVIGLVINGERSNVIGYVYFEYGLVLNIDFIIMIIGI